MNPEKQLAATYYKLLVSIDWTDDLMVHGLREGLNKFLSNAFASLFPGNHKYHRTHLISREALEHVSSKNYHDLIYEHLVPKARYIQRPCEELAKKGHLTLEFVETQLAMYWRIATVTKTEDSLLHRTAMPCDWDGKSVLARYANAGIELIPNPFFPLNRSE